MAIPADISVVDLDWSRWDAAQLTQALNNDVDRTKTQVDEAVIPAIQNVVPKVLVKGSLASTQVSANAVGCGGVTSAIINVIPTDRVERAIQTSTNGPIESCVKDATAMSAASSKTMSGQSIRWIDSSSSR